MTNSLSPDSKLKNGIYQISEMIRHDSSTITYNAECQDLSPAVTIKEFYPHHYVARRMKSMEITANTKNVAQARSKFFKDSMKIKALRHENIVHILDVFKENSTVYLVYNDARMANIEQHYLTRNLGYLYPNEDKLNSIIMRLLSAISALHRRGVIHADIRPSNILIDDRMENPCLLDTGSAVIRGDDAHHTSLITGHSEGCAPSEQFYSGLPIGTWTDMYALGGVLYHIMSGIKPTDSWKRLVLMEMEESSGVLLSDSPTALHEYKLPRADLASKNSYSHQLLETIECALNVDYRARLKCCEEFYDKIGFEPKISKSWRISAMGVLAFIAGKLPQIAKQRIDKRSSENQPNNAVLDNPSIVDIDATLRPNLRENLRNLDDSDVTLMLPK